MVLFCLVPMHHERRLTRWLAGGELWESAAASYPVWLPGAELLVATSPGTQVSELDRSQHSSLRLVNGDGSESYFNLQSEFRSAVFQSMGQAKTSGSSCLLLWVFLIFFPWFFAVMSTCRRESMNPAHVQKVKFRWVHTIPSSRWSCCGCWIETVAGWEYFGTADL
jgi:hypothetical protein